MFFSLASRILSSSVAFVYPTYASYKSLSQRPASAEDLERWLMYWSVLGVIMAVEYVAEWAISWVPFYWTIKTCLLLWLALPQTQGSTYLYRSRLAPLLTTYEPTIDSYLSQYKANLYTLLQDKLRSLWDIITEVIAKQTGVQLNAQNPAASSAAPTGTDDGRPGAAAGGGAAVVLGLWKAWGPVVTGALGPLQERVQRAVAEAAAAREAAAKPRTQVPPPAATRPLAFPLSNKSSSLSDTASILARRRQLEAELAALPNISVSSVQDDSERETTPTPPDLANISNLAQSVYLSDSAEVSESESLATGIGARGRFEKINKDEFGDESDDAPGAEPSAANRTSWFGAWTRRSGGYERVKSE